MTAELSAHPNTPQILVSNNEDSLYFHKNPNRMQYLLSEAIILERIGAGFFIYQNTVAGTEITDDFDVMNWFQIKKIRSPMLTGFTYIIHYITPLKTENERNFSLAGIYTAWRRANLSIVMLSDLIFINRNSAALRRNTTVDVFGGSLDAVVDIVDDMEMNPDTFADDSDTE